MSLNKVNYHTFYYLRLITICFFLVSCQTHDQEIIKRTKFVLGTLVEITVYEKDKDLAKKAITKSFDEMSRLENILSTYIPGSEISKLNFLAGIKNKTVPVSSDLFKVVQRGIYWGKFSSGAFDISINPVTKLWEFDSDSPTLPDAKKLLNAVSLIDYRDIFFKGNSISLKKTGMSLNLGAIGKGYAVDRAVETLKLHGIKNGLVNAGGDLMAFGLKDGTKPWNIGIQHPRKPEKIIASLTLKDKAVATSGDYQKYFILEGKRYHHILNSKNGWPSGKTISATVIANTVADADALSTALFILGEEKGLKLINSLEGVEGMILSNIKSTSFSSGFLNLPGLSLQNLKDNLAQ